MNSTPRFGLPFLAVGQAQKEVTVNESLQTIDSVVAAAVEDPPLDVPPASPSVGSTYVVGEAPTGDWSGKAQSLATLTGGGWRYVAAKDGMTAYVRSTDSYIAYRAGSWKQLLGAQAAAIASPSDGTIVDAQARTAIDQVLTVLRQHGLIES